jgi:sporulation protein YlmC with PRC-barrel domain
MNIEIGALMRLSDSGQMPADPHQDVRGRKVCDCDGYEIGEVDDLLIDPKQHKVRLLSVVHGGLLGDAVARSFIPVELVERLTADEVGIDRPRMQVARAPKYDPELGDHDERLARLYGHYGYTPYGSHGYVPPARVFFR